MPRYNTVRAAAVTAAAVVLLINASAEKTASQPPTAVSPAVPILMLDRVLEQTLWDPERRGPLLVVDPKNTRSEQPIPPPARPGGYTPHELAPHFKRKVTEQGTLTALVPTEMVVLNSRPGKADPAAGLPSNRKAVLLLASLTAAQWRLLGGERGLGAGDLNQAQRSLFLAMLPDPFPVRQIRLVALDNGRTGTTGDKPLVLTPAQRAGVRLRLQRTVHISVPKVGQPNFSLGFNTGKRREAGDTYFNTEGAGIVSERNRNSTYGVILRKELPNRLKPGHLPFDAPALAVSVSLDGAATVGELVERAGKATRLELYADRRVGSLPVWIKGGGSARAGDVLKTLCYAVTGTFRKLDSAYVLTDDIEGIGTRRARLAEWERAPEAWFWQRREALQKRVQSEQLLQHIGYAEDGFPVSPEIKQGIEKARSTWPGWANFEMPVTQLTPAQQARLRELIAESREQGLSTERVRISVKEEASFLVPDIGPVENWGLLNGLDFFLRVLPDPPSGAAAAPPPGPTPEPVRLTSVFTDRALYINPANSEEILRAVQEASWRGLNQLWVDIIPGEGIDNLTRAITAGKQRGISVFAVLSLLRAADDAPPETKDRDILGETPMEQSARLAHSATARPADAPPVQKARDWLRVGVQGVSAALLRRLKHIAALPSLGGIVFRETAAPGYNSPPRAERGGFSMRADERGFGYTPEMRLQFLRQARIDPVDLVPNGNSIGTVSLTLPYFPDSGGSHGQGFRTGVGSEVSGGAQEDMPPLRQWDVFRYNTNVRLLSDLYTSLRAEHPQLSLLIRNRVPDNGPGDFLSWYGSWDKPGSIPIGPLGFGTPHAQAARSFSRRTLFHLPYAVFKLVRQPEKQQLAGIVGALAQGRMGKWDGIVLDFSDQAVDDVLPLLEALPQVNP